VCSPGLLAQLPELHTGTLGAPASGEGGAAPIAPPRPSRALSLSCFVILFRFACEKLPTLLDTILILI
jgi:hypothetical protein